MLCVHFHLDYVKKKRVAQLTRFLPRWDFERVNMHNLICTSREIDLKF